MNSKLKKIDLIIISIFFFQLISCNSSNNHYTQTMDKSGIKLTINTNKNKDNKINFNAKLLYSINTELRCNSQKGLDNYIELDKNGNLFLVSSNEMRVNKYNTFGQFLLFFGGLGYGPGEMGEKLTNNPINGIEVHEDTISVFLQALNKYNLYDLDGNFFKSVITKNFNYLGIPISKGLKIIYEVTYKKLNYSDFLRFISFYDQKEWSVDLSIIKYDNVSKNFEVENLYNKHSKLNNDFYSFVRLKHVVKRKEIYLAVNSKEKYEIIKYDFQGNKIHSIRKNYRKIKYPLQDIEKNEIISDDIQYIIKNLKGHYMQSIRRIYVDKNERIWVLSSEDIKFKNISENNFSIYQVFDKNGIFLGKIDLNFMNISIEELCFKKKKLFIYGKDHNKINKLFVWDY